MRATRIDKKTGKPHISERAFTAQVISLARYLGWRCAHFRPAQSQTGRWLTAVQGDGAGFPDLVLANAVKGKLIFAELKADGGRVADAQKVWLDTLRYCHIPSYLWHPSDYDEIERILR